MVSGDLHWSTVYLAIEWVIRLTMLAIVPQQRSPAAARTWLLLIFLLPIPGLVLYGIIGRVYLPRRRIEMQRRASEVIRLAQERLSASFIAIDLPEPAAMVSSLTVALGDFRPFAGNAVELITAYEDGIGRLVDDIESARYEAHLLTYIFAPDAIGARVSDALLHAARRGVTCRLVVDAVGSSRGLKQFSHAWRAAGIEVHAALPMGSLRRRGSRFDLRNHRKIAVIDGSVGYIGSQNIADPNFIPDYPNEELVVRMTGPAVAQLQALFASDFYFESGRALDAPVSFPKLGAAGSSVVQLLPSGPAYGRENAKELMVTLAYAARARIVVTTPYLIPDESFLQALGVAARRGVDVRIVVSLHANQRLAQLAQQSYYEALLDAGVGIYLYRPRFLHAKHMSVDDNVAMIGSVNADIRSFSLNAEASLLVYDRAIVARLRGIQERYFAESDRLSAKVWAARPVTARMAQNVARLADSFL